MSYNQKQIKFPLPTTPLLMEAEEPLIEEHSEVDEGEGPLIEDQANRNNILIAHDIFPELLVRYLSIRDLRAVALTCSALKNVVYDVPVEIADGDMIYPTTYRAISTRMAFFNEVRHMEDEKNELTPCGVKGDNTDIRCCLGISAITGVDSMLSGCMGHSQISSASGCTMVSFCVVAPLAFSGLTGLCCAGGIINYIHSRLFANKVGKFTAAIDQFIAENQPDDPIAALTELQITTAVDEGRVTVSLSL